MNASNIKDYWRVPVKALCQEFNNYSLCSHQTRGTLMRRVLYGLCRSICGAFEFQGVFIIAFVPALNLSCICTMKNFGSPWHVESPYQCRSVWLRICTANIAAWQCDRGRRVYCLIQGDPFTENPDKLWENWREFSRPGLNVVRAMHFGVHMWKLSC